MVWRLRRERRISSKRLPIRDGGGGELLLMVVSVCNGACDCASPFAGHIPRVHLDLGGALLHAAGLDRWTKNRLVQSRQCILRQETLCSVLPHQSTKPRLSCHLRVQALYRASIGAVYIGRMQRHQSIPVPFHIPRIHRCIGVSIYVSRARYMYYCQV